jgi:hypothetical protein
MQRVIIVFMCCLVPLSAFILGTILAFHNNDYATGLLWLGFFALIVPIAAISST